jgi:hypothetical protein
VYYPQSQFPNANLMTGKNIPALFTEEHKALFQQA